MHEKVEHLFAQKKRQNKDKKFIDKINYLFHC